MNKTMPYFYQMTVTNKINISAQMPDSEKIPVSD